MSACLSTPVSAPLELTPALYTELRKIASRHLRSERPNHTLQPTALVHEAFLKLSRESGRELADQGHYLALASRVMRQVLVDYARARTSKKRFGDVVRESAEIEMVADTPELTEVLAVDAALAALAVENPTMAKIVEMRYFGGMTAEESAVALGISVHIVRHDLRFAQAWLRRKLEA